MKREYDVVAKIYDPLLSPFLRSIRSEVVDTLYEQRSSRILDLCCGTGDQLKHLSKHGFKDLHGVDLSPSMLKVAREGDNGIRLYKRDATSTGFPNASFDNIIISLALHEKDAITRNDMLKEAHRLLRTHGQLVLVDFTIDKKTKIASKVAIDLIERTAGTEHHDNFTKYVALGGIPKILKGKGFVLDKVKRKLFSGMGIFVYKKA